MAKAANASRHDSPSSIIPKENAPVFDRSDQSAPAKKMAQTKASFENATGSSLKKRTVHQLKSFHKTEKPTAKSRGERAGKARLHPKRLGRARGREARLRLLRSEDLIKIPSRVFSKGNGTLDHRACMHRVSRAPRRRPPVTSSENGVRFWVKIAEGRPPIFFARRRFHESGPAAPGVRAFFQKM